MEGGNKLIYKNINSVIARRKSCRSYLPKEVSIEDIYTILESARWAPSGKNGQPWRFIIVKNKEIKKKIADCSIYGNWMNTADSFIVVYLDKEKSYNYKKDIQGIGAAIENICLQATYMEIGTCWIGEILKNEQQVNKFLEVPKSFELMAIICVGYEDKKTEQVGRLAMEEIVYKTV